MEKITVIYNNWLAVTQHNLLYSCQSWRKVTSNSVQEWLSGEHKSKSLHAQEKCPQSCPFAVGHEDYYTATKMSFGFTKIRNVEIELKD